MATIASGVATLNDVIAEIAPDGSQLEIAEVLTQATELLEDMTWREGNLLTGHRDAVRTVLPEPSYRAINEGVPITKGASTQIEETCAMLEDFSQADRELAILSGNVNGFRIKQATPHIQGFAHKLSRDIFYGNVAANAKSFTGLAPRYNSLSTAVSQTANNVINAGGTGTGLRSIWLIGWQEDAITGLYPKNTVGGLKHEDATNAAGSGGDGIPPAAVLFDASGNPYMGYRDHWTWRCGLMVKDWRAAVRICNVDLDLLTKNPDSGQDILDLMVQALENIQAPSGARLVFYMPKIIRSFLRRQLLTRKGAFLSWDEMAGKRVLMFGEAPIKRVDALNVEEAQVV